MKPTSMKPRYSSTFLSGNYNYDFGKDNTIAKVQGNVKKLGTAYQDSLVVLYNKKSLLPIAATKPDANGNFKINGLNLNISSFIMCFSSDPDFNALTFDRIVPV